MSRTTISWLAFLLFFQRRTAYRFFSVSAIYRWNVKDAYEDADRGKKINRRRRQKCETKSLYEDYRTTWSARSTYFAGRVLQYLYSVGSSILMFSSSGFNNLTWSWSFSWPRSAVDGSRISTQLYFVFRRLNIVCVSLSLALARSHDSDSDTHDHELV